MIRWPAQGRMSADLRPRRRAVQEEPPRSRTSSRTPASGSSSNWPWVPDPPYTFVVRSSDGGAAALGDGRGRPLDRGARRPSAVGPDAAYAHKRPVAAAEVAVWIGGGSLLHHGDFLGDRAGCHEGLPLVELDRDEADPIFVPHAEE